MCSFIRCAGQVRGIRLYNSDSSPLYNCDHITFSPYNMKPETYAKNNRPFKDDSECSQTFQTPCGPSVPLLR